MRGSGSISLLPGGLRPVSGIGIALVLVMLLPGFAAAQDEPKNEPDTLFLGYASQYFKWRCDHAASTNLYVNTLADDKAFERFSLDWYKGLSEPRHFLRIGIGVSYSAKGYSGPILVVGTQEAARGGNRGGGGDPDGASTGLARGNGPSAIGSAGGNSQPTAEPAEDETPADYLKKYGGGLAELLVERLNSRRLSGKGKFGAVLRVIDDVQVELTGSSKGRENESEANNSADGSAGPSPEEFVRPQRAQAFRSDVPAPAPPASLGSGPVGGATETTNAMPQRDPGAEEAERKKKEEEERRRADPLRLEVNIDDVGGRMREEFRSVHPGVVCLNEGTRAELIERARRQGVDLLFVIDVQVRENRGSHYSLTSVRLLDMKDPEKVVAQTKAIRSDADTAEKDRRTGKTLLETEMDKLLQPVDENYTASEMPAGLKPEHVASRVDRLMKSINKSNRLLVAAEIMGFYRKGLMDGTRAASALEEILQGGGELVLSGDKADRISFLKKIARESN